MEQPLAFYVEEIYNRAYFLFLAANNVRSMTSSSYLTDVQKLALAKGSLEQIMLDGQGLVDRTDEIYDAFYPEEEVQFVRVDIPEDEHDEEEI